MARTGLIDHIGLAVPDLAAAKRYYDALMPILGLRAWFETSPDGPLNYGPDGAHGTQLFFYQAREVGDYARERAGLQHIAFAVESRAIVREAHAWALAQSAAILHEPREFPEYGQHYATYWLDPHGFKLEVVCFEPEAPEAARSVRTTAMKPGDEQRLDAFLRQSPEVAVLLRSNLYNEGLRDEGRALQGTWLAALDDHDTIVGVAAHFHLGTMVLAAPTDCERLATTCSETSGRQVAGLLGPWSQVQRARAALGLQSKPAQLESPEQLFALALRDLIVPPALQGGPLTWHLADVSEHALLASWRAAYHVEALGARDDAETRAKAAAEVERAISHGDLYVLSDAQDPVACSSIVARIPDTVSIGGVWTPPALRRRGYGRAVVAASLLDLRTKGVERAVLFTEADNYAKRAYEAIGFRVIGDYGLVLWATD